MDGETRRLAEVLSALARTMHAESGPDSLLGTIVEASVAEIPGAEQGGITIATRTRLSTHAETDEVVARVDQAQYRLGQGPCVESAWTMQVRRSDDLRDDERWPEFAYEATELGIRSMLSLPLFAQTNRFGALNLYAGKPDAFDEDAENIGRLLASHAAIAIAAARKETNLRLALDSRDVIGQAKGILMERHKVSSQRAFELLAEASRRTHRRIRDIADELTATGALPESPRRPPTWPLPTP